MGSTDNENRNVVTVHWFRHGLRLHDNPALLEGLENCQEFYPIFIFDGSVAGTKTAGYCRMQFLLESLKDLDDSLRAKGSRLYVMEGDPLQIFPNLFEEWKVNMLTFEQDPEPIWQERDDNVKDLCDSYNVEWIERVSHTLWDPHSILKANGGSPPLTYAMFCQVAEIVGQPPRPVEDLDFSNVILPVSDNHDRLFGLPTLEKLEVVADCDAQKSPFCRYLGGEAKALVLLESRLDKERKTFSIGQAQANQMYPDLTGMPMSLSPHLRFGSLSIRKFYWALRDAFAEIHPESEIPLQVTSQLVWREYFYCMSVNNPFYNRMAENPICLNIDWYTDDTSLEKWTEGKTGYPFIDACMRQLKQEGWIHQVCRHAVSCFLTRGDLWIDWQKGLEVFDRYLLDADWSVCAGNWMWVSSSAFEKVLQCSRCICPVRYGRRMDPNGDYIRRYVPELKNIPLTYLYEPWKAPIAVQEGANCIIGTDYPPPIVDHRAASRDCKQKMEIIKAKYKDTPHVAPANEDEVIALIWMTKDKEENRYSCDHSEERCNADAI
uniref:Cryptochrome-1 n=1 Tax=Hermissenda crassicornis TaxID=205593 RepID=A0A2Z4QK91_HERCR|nr:photoreceptive cryptochrome [Hermissenda crassicornis]